ncbi:MAG: hypothetical protein Q4B50_05150, partial [Bacillota bacterium]|nr:hypothetical protein [Bacillota bacterium]
LLIDKQVKEYEEKQKQEKKNKKAEKQGKDTPGKQEEKDNRMLGDTPPLEEKLGPGAEHQAPSKEKARPSMQPHRPLVQEKLFLDQDLKREEERWMETKDWKERTRNLLFKEKSQEVIREMNGIDKSRDDDLIGCIAGLLGRGAGEKQNSQEQKQRQNILDRLLNSGTEMSSEFDMQLNLGLSAFKDAKQALRNNNKEPMQKLLHDTVVELSKAASSGTELSERNQIIGRYITETMRFAKENNLDIGLSKKELTAAKGAVEMGNIATKGTMARQSLGKQENLDLNDPTTQNVLNDYMTMKSVEAGMRVGGKKGNYSDIQLIVGSTGSNQFYGLVRNSSDMRGLLSDPEGAKTVTNMVEKPHGMVADLKGHQMMSESLDKIISAKSAKPDDPQLHLQKQKENINVKTA